MFKIYNDILPKNLYELDDKINDEIHLIKPAESQRDKAFIYFNNNIYIGTTHVVAFNTIKELNNKQKQVYLKYRFLRKQINTEDKISFGHILNGNIGIIDSYTNLNCTDEEVKNALQQFGCKKVYIGYTPKFDLKDIKRVAKGNK